MKNKIIITIVLCTIALIAIVCVLKNKNDIISEKRIDFKSNCISKTSGNSIITSVLPKKIEQKTPPIKKTNTFDNVISNNCTDTENTAEEGFAALEIILSGGLNIPFEGNVSIQTHDFLNIYPDQNIKKELSGDNDVLFEKVSPGDCKISAQINGYLNMSTNLSLSDYAGSKIYVMLSLIPVQFLRGKIVDYATKKEIAGVEISASDKKTYTDGCGRFLIDDLSSSIVDVLVVHDDYPTQTFRVSIPKIDEPDIILELKKISKITGYVIDQNGAVIPNCNVIIPEILMQNNKIVLHDSYNPIFQTHTDKKGFFKFEVMKTGSSIIRFLADTGTAHGYTDLKFNPGEEQEITIVVTNSYCWLEIIAKDTNANPVTETIIYISHNSQTEYSKDSSSNGIFLFSYETACTQDLILVEAKGFMTESVSNIIMHYNYTTTVEFIMQPMSGELIGRIERANGKPANSMLVIFFAIENSNFFKYTFTNLAGEFLISSVNPEYHYKIQTQIPIIYPKKAVQVDEYINVKLEAYSEVCFRPLATNSLEFLKNIIYIASPKLQTNEENSKVARLKDGFYNIVVPGSGDYFLYLKPQGYKSTIIHRYFKPDEDVDLGSIYFEPED